jgi:isocitrate dehydrogenase
MNKIDQMDEALWRVWVSPRKWASILSTMRELDSMGSKATSKELEQYLKKSVKKGMMAKRILFGILPEYRPITLVELDDDVTR